jgi:hypothetical protein
MAEMAIRAGLAASAGHWLAAAAGYRLAAPAGHRLAAGLLLRLVELLWRRRIIDYILLRAVRS